MTLSHCAGSPSTNARTAAPKSSPEAAPIDWTCASTCWSSSWNRILISVIGGYPRRGSTEPSGDIRLGPLIVRVGKDLLSSIVLHEHPGPHTFGLVDLRGQECRHVAHAR